MELFKKLYIEWKGEEQFKDPQYKAIPRFYFKVPRIFYCDRPVSCKLLMHVVQLRSLQNVVSWRRCMVGLPLDRSQMLNDAELAHCWFSVKFNLTIKMIE